MITMIDSDDICTDLDSLADKYGIPEFSSVKMDVERLEQELQARIDELESENEDLEARVGELEGKDSCDLEDFVSSLLRYADGDEPSLGLVLAVTDDIRKLLVEKYHISKVNL